MMNLAQTSTAFVAVSIVCMTLALASTSVSQYYQKCPFFRDQGGSCCQSCSWDFNRYLAWCQLDKFKCLKNDVLGVGFAQPLGMQSGRIHASQLSSHNGANTVFLSNARLFTSENGWRPDKVYLNSRLSLLSLSTVSLATLRQAPVFFQVTFTRMQKIVFVVIQTANHIQKFSLLHKQTSDFESSFVNFECEFGIISTFLGCRHVLESPFRANVVRIVSQDYSNHHRPYWKIEFGGMDYLEADHLWRFDKIMMRHGKGRSEFPDERGDIPLLTSLVPHVNNKVTSFIYSTGWERWTIRQSVAATLNNEHKACFLYHAHCGSKLSASFWFFTSKSPMLLNFHGPKFDYTGFSFKWKDEKMTVYTSTVHRLWVVSGIIPECEATSGCKALPRWHHFALTWNLVSGLSLYIDGKLAGTKAIGTSRSYKSNKNRDLFIDTSIRDFRIWNHVLSHSEVQEVFNSDSIDFTITAFDQLGDWKLGIACTETSDTGPCTDQSFFITPGDSIAPLYYICNVNSIATYYLKQCETSYTAHIQRTSDNVQNGVVATTGISIQVDSHFNYEDVTTATLWYNAVFHPNVINARIYVASSYDYDGKYISHCRFRNFQHDVYAGPIHWSAKGNPENSHRAPDIIDIIRPFLDRSREQWRKSIFVIIEWLAPAKQSFSMTGFRFPYLHLKYADKRPDKYIYADASMAPKTDFPLRYTTRPFVPRVKCLNFWYHMNGSGIGLLSVTVHQDSSLHKEVFRLHGSQGNAWRMASVPLDTSLNTSAGFFEVTFTAVRGANTIGDIAIDSINVTMQGCSLFPPEAMPPMYTKDLLASVASILNLPVPVLILPLDTGLYHLSDNVRALQRAKTPSSYAMDTFGFPLNNTLFNGTSDESGIKVILSAEILNISYDFAITLNVRPFSLEPANILFFVSQGKKELSIAIGKDGNISLGLLKPSGDSEFTSRVRLKNNTWNYLVFVYSRNDQLLRIYSNATLMEELSVGHLRELATRSRILIGHSPSGKNSFMGHMTCLQLFNQSLEAHVIKALRLCLNKHVVYACQSRCPKYAACDQITGKCLCPSYANRYVFANCSRSLEKSVYKEFSLLLVFAKRGLKNNVGKGDFYRTIDIARNKTNVSSPLYFMTPGVVNLAVCTASSLPVIYPRSALGNPCVLQDTCTSAYSLSIWLNLPWKHGMKNETNIHLVSIGRLQVQFNYYLESNSSTSSFLAIFLSSSTELCEWQVSCANEMMGVWTNLVISINERKPSVFLNGQFKRAFSKSCSPMPVNQKDLLLGGSVPYVCFDELVFWDHSLATSDAKRLFNAISYSGYNWPKKLNFSMLSFNDENASLWAVDTNNMVYYYDLSSHWIKVGENIKHVSSGCNGVWAVNTDRQPLFRDGVTESNPRGTAWRLVTIPTSSSLSNKVWKIQSTYTPGVVFAIAWDWRIYCLSVSSGTISTVTKWNHYLRDISCYRFSCCGQNRRNQTQCYFGVYNCRRRALTTISPNSSSLYMNSNGTDFIRILDGKVSRSRDLQSPTWSDLPPPRKAKFKYVVGIDGKAVGITTNGDMMLLETGVSPWKSISSFYPKKTLNGTFNGEIKIKIIVMFRFNNFKFLPNLRDQNGFEAKFVYERVNNELEHHFVESYNYRKSTFGEIRFKRQLPQSCPTSPTLCTNHLEVELTAYVWLAYLSPYEKSLLLHEKFNGQPSSCKEHTCQFELSDQSRQDLSAITNIQLVNITSSSIVLRYIPRANAGVHIGYNIFYAWKKKRQPEVLFFRKTTLKDGLVFTIAPLSPYSTYNLTIKPLELQSNSTNPANIILDTMATAPSGSPVISIQYNYHWYSKFNIKDLSPLTMWNGEPIGYVVYYAELLPHQIPTLDMENTRLYQTKKVRYKAKLFYLTGLKVFTRYVVYVGAYNAAGTGPLSRRIFRTSAGRPEAAPRYVDAYMSWLYSDEIEIFWATLPDNMEVWNIYPQFYRGYLINIAEFSVPSIMPSELNVRVSNDTSYYCKSLPESREYAVRVAAQNEKGVGKWSHQICFVMPDGIPTSAPTVVTALANSSSSLNITVGNISLREEKGFITHYNISLTFKTANELNVVYELVNLTSYRKDGSSINRTSWCYSMIETLPKFSYDCPATNTVIPRSSLVVTYSVSQLRYWTVYMIAASACTCKGCGPFSSPISVRTKEDIPECSPTNLTTHKRTSTSIEFTWNKPWINCTHGILRKYRVYFGPTTDSISEYPYPDDFEPFTKGEVFYFRETKVENLVFSGLKKNTEYCCEVAAATDVGIGPVSMMYYARTLEDRPDGPPTNITAIVLESGVQISMQPPVRELANGIIRGYMIYHSARPKTESYSSVAEFHINVTASIIGNLTSQIILGLKSFTWYRFQVAAYTSVGIGVRGNLSTDVLTPELVPSAAPSEISMLNTTKDGFKLAWSPLSVDDMNGRLTNFLLIINETLADDSQGACITTFITPYTTPLTSKSSRPYSLNTSSSRNTSSELFDCLVLNISSSHWNNTQYTQDEATGMLILQITGLKPFTTYSIQLAACTIVGCGIKGNYSFRSQEYVPSSSPVTTITARTTSIEITWETIPILQRNGILTNFSLRWIKQCNLVREKFPLNITADCNRLVPENSTEFSLKNISVDLNHTTISDLMPYAFYIIKLAAETSVGRGPDVEALIRTEEGTPSVAPNITLVHNTSGRSIKMRWDNIALPDQHGFLLGYTIFYQRTEPADINGTAAHQKGNNSTSTGPQQVNCSEGIAGFTEYELTGLDLFSNYNISVAGYTSKGLGARTSHFMARTGPYVHGGWTDWSKWNYCSKSCGGGTQKRVRTCSNPPAWNGGDECEGTTLETKTCNTKKCSGVFAASVGVNCQSFCNEIGFVCMPEIYLQDSNSTFKELGLWCSDRSREPVWKQPYHPSYAANTGLCAGYLRINETVPCAANPPNDGYTRRICNCLDRDDVGFTQWAGWSTCTKTCGGGERRSKRECSVPGACVGNSTQFQDCNTTPCPVDGVWGLWSPYSPCNKSCGYGYQHRYRKCDSPPMSNGGQVCPGESEDVIGECNTHICPVHGGWSNWEGNGICDQACGGGQSIKRRYCDSPKPLYGGDYCEGANNISQPCNQHKCKAMVVSFWLELTDFIWDFLYYSMSNSGAQRIASICKQNFEELYKDKPYVPSIQVKQLRNKLPGAESEHRKRRSNRQKHVVANIEVSYSAVKQSEILYVQDTIGATGKLNNLSITASEVEPITVIAGPPRNLTATGVDPYTIQLNWLPPVNMSQLQGLTTYYMFYRKEYGAVGSWQVRATHLNSNFFNITRLDAFTSYRFRMTVSADFGNGPASKEVIGTTLEGVPEVAPSNVAARSTQPTELYVQWDETPYEYFNGLPLGYVVQYKLYKESVFRTVEVISRRTSLTLKGLKPFSLYIVTVEAYTATGSGPPSPVICKTLEGVPSIAPPGVTVLEMFSMNELIVKWNAINNDQANGRFKGYKVRYRVVRVSSKATSATSRVSEIVVDKYTFTLKLFDLESYTTYAVSVLGYTEAGDGPISTPIDADTCKCPENIFLNWHESRPYIIKDKQGEINGIFKDIVDEMIVTSCDTCNGVASTVNWKRSLTGESPQKTSEIRVKEAIGDNYHVSLPIFGRSEITTFAERHVFISLVNSPGSAMIVRDTIDFTAKTINTFKSMAAVWPMLVIIILFSFVFGILLWFAERFQNEEFDNKRFLNGFFQGFWWAYISITTVGYGDITPRSVLGRFITIIWTVIGLVLMGIITGALTSSITSKTIPPDFKLYGSTAAVINNSFEYKLAVRRNSKVFVGWRIENIHAVLSTLQQQMTDVALLDAFAAAAWSDRIHDMELKVKELISGNSGYGIVLSNEMVRLEDDCRSHVSSKQQMISSFVANMTSRIEISTKKHPVVMLLDPSTPSFWMVLEAELFTLAVMWFLGIVFTIYRHLKGRGNKVNSNSISARKIGFVDSFEGLICEFDSKVSKRAEELNTRHDQEKGDLAQLKQNFRRLEKRMRRQGGNFHSIHHVINRSTETQSSQPRRNAEKYRALQENSRRDTDC